MPGAILPIKVSRVNSNVEQEANYVEKYAQLSRSTRPEYIRTTDGLVRELNTKEAPSQMPARNFGCASLRTAGTALILCLAPRQSMPVFRFRDEMFNSKYL